MTDSELALVKVKTGRLTTNLDEIVVRLPRSGVVSTDLGNGVICPLTITFGNGDVWRLELSRLNKKHGHAVVRALAARAE